MVRRAGMRTVSIAEAKAHLSKLVEQAEAGDPVCITRRGKPDELVISDWVVAEFSAALAAKLRAGRVDVSERAAALAGFGQLCAGSFTILPLARAHFQMAARFADQHTLGLRAPDALHVALCLDLGAVL